MAELNVTLSIIPAWKLGYECRQPKGMEDVQGGRNGSITFTAPTASEAVASARRWMRGRLKFPEFFGEFTYFQISPYQIGPIDENGSLSPGAGFRLMEWSRCRAGVDMETYCDWKIAEYQRLEAKDAAQKP